MATFKIQVIKNTEAINMDKKEARIRILGKIFMYTVEFFHRKEFVQLMPVMLGKSVDPLGPDPGSSVVKIPEIEYNGQVLRLVTSMILHKQYALRTFDRLFIMSPNIRLERKERIKSGRHLFEFTQADFEIANAKMEDVFSLVEEYYSGLTGFLEKEAGEEFKVIGTEIFRFSPPFKRYTTKELKERYGEEWERRASLEHEQPFWALSHKREFYDKEDEKQPGEYLNYDIIYPLGYGEGLSGAEREHEYERIVMRMKRDGMDFKSYEAYLKYAREGFTPSAGAGIGMERLARFLTKASHIKDVQLFKRVPGIKVEI